MGGTSCDVALIKDGEPVVLQPRQDRRPRHRRADDGHQHGERRRRHHRQGRPFRRARSRAAERRRGARPGLLRPRRRDADHHRLQSRARLSQRRQFPRRPHAARPRQRRERRSRRVRQAARRSTSRKRPKASCASSTSRWRRRSRRSRPCAATTCAISCCSPSAAPARCTPAASPRDLGMAGVIVPLYPGVFSAIGLLMSDVKHDYIRSRMTPIAELTPDDVEAVFAQLGGAGARRPAPRRLRRRRHPHRSRARHALRRPGLRDRRSPATRRRRRRRSPRLRRRSTPSTSRLFGHMAPDEPVEVVSYRLRGIGRVPPVADAEIRADRQHALPRRLREHAAGALRRRDASPARSISANGSMSA